MPQNSSRLTPRSLVVICLLGMMLLGGGIYFGVNYAVERAVVVDAQDKAQQWTAYFLTAMPNLDSLLANGKLTPQQSEVIRTAEKVGGVFRFKLYNPSARRVLVSDDSAEADEDDDAESADQNPTVSQVLATGMPSIELHETPGDEEPALFVEAYVPIIDHEGAKHGIVEVYIDQARTAALLRTTFAMLAIGLAIVAALAFGLPALGFLFRSRQVHEARTQADFLAAFDPMTGVLNRSAFADRLHGALAGPSSGLALVSFDVDHIKAMNDERGHAGGDAFLAHVARCIKGALTEAEFCGRPDGDEFVALLQGRDEAGVTAFVETVMSSVRQPVDFEGAAITGEVSAGVHYIEGGSSAAQALHRAEVALFQAKVDGRNVMRVFAPGMDVAMAARRALEQRLQEATANESFEVYFQPLLRADTRMLAGFEALLRLRDANGQMIPPSTFIPVAEELGLINRIGEWVLRHATVMAASWPKELFVAINLSVKQFGDGELVGHVRSALAQSGLSPTQLELEITESTLIDNSETVGRQLHELKALGVSIAMDDFGTGYSSLGYLWQFGFDKLKIDRSFVAALDTDDGRAREVLDTIVVLGHKLGMTVTAEGIETDRQATILAGLACDHFQGFLYGRPMPATDLPALLLRSQAQEIAMLVEGRTGTR